MAQPTSSSPQDLLNHIADAATSTPPLAAPFTPPFQFLNSDTTFHPPAGVMHPFESSSSGFDRAGAAQAYKQVGNSFPFEPMPGFQAPQHSPDSKEEGEEDWNNSGQSNKRKRDTEYLRQKHSNREKRRRSDMNDAISRLKELLPRSDKNRQYRATKVTTMNEAIDYITKLKDQLNTTLREKRILQEENYLLTQQLGRGGHDPKGQLLNQLASAPALKDNNMSLSMPNNSPMLHLPSVSQQSLHYLPAQQAQSMQEQVAFMQQQAVPDYLAAMLQQERTPVPHQAQHQIPHPTQSTQPQTHQESQPPLMPQLPQIQPPLQHSNRPEQSHSLEVQPNAALKQLQPLLDPQSAQHQMPHPTQPTQLQTQQSPHPFLQTFPGQTETSHADPSASLQNFLPLPQQLESEQGETLAAPLPQQTSQKPEELAILLQAFKDDDKEALIRAADKAHDEAQAPDKSYNLPFVIFNTVSKYVDCYHVEYKLGLYCEAGWTGRQPAPEEAATHWDKLDQLIKAPVEAGELRAIFDFAVIHERGYGRTAQRSEAERLYKLASEKGSVKAQHNLGLFYEHGHDYERTLQFYTQAAESGFPLSLNNLALCYLRGRGVERDIPTAEKYLKLAAQGGSTVAAKSLGQFYRRGEVLRQDFGQALKYFKMSQNHTESKIWLAILWKPFWTQVMYSQRDDESTLVHGNTDVHNVIISAIVDIYFSTLPSKLAEYAQFESNIRGLEP